MRAPRRRQRLRDAAQHGAPEHRPSPRPPPGGGGALGGKLRPVYVPVLAAQPPPVCRRRRRIVGFGRDKWGRRGGRVGSTLPGRPGAKEAADRGAPGPEQLRAHDFPLRQELTFV